MLYKDPNGEKVFSDNEGEVRQATKLSGTPLSGESETDILQKKIKHLETMMSEYQVCKSSTNSAVNALWSHNDIFGAQAYVSFSISDHALIIQQKDCRCALYITFTEDNRGGWHYT